MLHSCLRKVPCSFTSVTTVPKQHCKGVHVPKNCITASHLLPLTPIQCSKVKELSSRDRKEVYGQGGLLSQQGSCPVNLVAGIKPKPISAVWVVSDQQTLENNVFFIPGPKAPPLLSKSGLLCCKYSILFFRFDVGSEEASVLRSIFYQISPEFPTRAQYYCSLGPRKE